MTKRVCGPRWIPWVAAVGLVLGLWNTARSQGPLGAKVGAATPGQSGPIDRASCVVMLHGGTHDRMLGGIDLGTLSAVMTSTELVDPAAKAALGLGPEEWPRAAQVELSPVGLRAMKVTVTVAQAEKETRRPEAAQVFLRELLSRSKGVIDQMGSPRRREVKERVEALAKRRDELRVQVEDLRKRSRAAESRPSALLGAGPFQAQQRQQLESQLANRKPRLDAIKAVLPQSQDQLGEVDAAIRDLVAAREALATALAAAVEEGKADRLELLRARADLAEARSRQAAGGGGPSPLRRYRDELVSLDIEVRVLQAQLAALPAAPTTGPDEPPAEDAQRIRFNLSQAENELRTTEANLQQVQRELEQSSGSSSLVVLDGREGG